MLSTWRSNSNVTYRINENTLTPKTIRKEKSKEPIKAKHGWMWAQAPRDFFRVVEAGKSRIEVYSIERLPEGATSPKPEVMLPFPALSIKDSVLRSGGIKRTSETRATGVDDLPTIAKLQDYLPSECFPDILEVHNISGISMYSTQAEPVTYKRAVPSPLVDFDSSARRLLKPQKSVLSLWQYLDSGFHGTVFRASLSLPEPYETIQGDEVVNIVVKIVNDNSKAREHFNREVDAYNLLSRPSHNFLQKDWTGYVACTGSYGYMSTQMRAGLQPTAAPLRAVVPKFFGLYEPVESNVEMGSLLLIEDCGTSVENYKMHSGRSKHERSHVFSELRAQASAMYASLHRAGFLQCSVKRSNIAIQPGPLCLPSVERSYDNPSFRILDFGRAVIYNGLAGKDEFRGDRLPEDAFRDKAREEQKEVFKDVC